MLLKDLLSHFFVLFFFCFYINRLLDNKDKASFEPKLKSFEAVFKKLTGADATFEFPVQEQE